MVGTSLEFMLRTSSRRRWDLKMDNCGSNHCPIAYTYCSKKLQVEPDEDRLPSLVVHGVTMAADMNI